MVPFNIGHELLTSEDFHGKKLLIWDHDMLVKEEL